MEATEARQRTEEVIKQRKRHEAALAREVLETAERKKAEHELGIQSLANTLREQVDVLIDAAIAEERFTAQYSWVGGYGSSEDSVTDEAEFNAFHDQYEAYVVMTDQLEKEGFKVMHSGSNVNAFSQESTMGEKWNYIADISWRAGKEKNIFQKIFSTKLFSSRP